MISSSVTLRAVRKRDGGDGNHDTRMYEGYAAKFNSRSLPLGFTGFCEKIDSKAFDETHAKGLDVRFIFNHNPSNGGGAHPAGTLKLSRDDVGLRFEV
jgi:HK97 family phage prohead protease